ncbi:MAG: hypothetical protein INQ03_14615 [Candidatus Heimdallarchaeota archaeon]|nr:hypothetical protein [Candidatus Heimdallarchaeota archaeon]
MKNRIIFLIINLSLIVLLLPAGPAQGIDLTINSGVTDYLPSVVPDYLDRARTANFIRSTQSSPKYNASSIDQIFYRIAAISILDPALNSISQVEKDMLIQQIMSFQSSDAGFGQWQYDRAGLSSTNKAIEALSLLNALDQVNATAVGEYLDSLRNYLTDGYNSHSADTDADVYTTSLAMETYHLLNLPIVNSSKVVDLFLRAQNNESSGFTAPNLGGFGKQTNNVKGIFWDSEVSVTRGAVFSLNSFSTSAETSLVIDFLKGMQTGNGGFVNSYLQTSETISYTASALETLSLLGDSADNTLALSFINSLETVDGGFKYQSTSVSSSIKSTYFALLALESIGGSPSNTTKTLEYLVNYIPDLGGYGAVPGAEPSLRTTFDAVAALSYMNRTPTLVTKITDYVDSYRNIDGGFGLSGSYVESTLRAVEIYNLLAVPFPNPAETITFLKSNQQLDGGFSKGAGKSISYVISTYRTVKALDLLGSSPDDIQGVISYLDSTYNSADGGYGGFFNDNSDISSTYRAIRTLNLLGISNFDKAAVVNFVKNSQNLDGGFKRSSYDIVRPNNISNAVYTYSALQTLNILDEQPNNVSSVYSYILSLRNLDGGYAEHPDFTSDVAYTFTSMWIFLNLNTFAEFKLSLPTNLSFETSQNLVLKVSGKLNPITYSISTVSGYSVSGTLLAESNYSVVLAAFLPGIYEFHIELFDLAKQGIIIDISVSISDPTSESNTSPQVSNSTPPMTSTSSQVTDTTSQVSDTSSQATTTYSVPSEYSNFTTITSIPSSLSEAIQSSLADSGISPALVIMLQGLAFVSILLVKRTGRK